MNRKESRSDSLLNDNGFARHAELYGDKI